MYASVAKNESSKHRSDDLDYFSGGYIAVAGKEADDLPESVYLTKGNVDEKKFFIRLDLPSKYIEIPLSMAQLSEWFSQIEKEQEEQEEQEKEKIALERSEIGQEKFELHRLEEDV
jgi:hypothetical protein